MIPAFDDPKVMARLKFVLPIIDGELSLHEAARQTGLARRAIKKYVDRFQEHGVEGLRNRPRGRSPPTSPAVVEQILSLKRERRGRSARKIRDLLREKGITVHRQTVYRILREHGEHRREPKQLKPDKDFEYPAPNDCWQTDLMDGIIVKGLGLVFLHSFIDDHSREIMGAEWFTSRNAQHLLKVFKSGLERNGLPKRVLADHGTQFKASLGKGLTQYERVLHRLGIEAMFASIGKPKAKGKQERFYAFVQSDFLQEYDFRSLDDLNAKWQRWLHWYSTQHEHASLNGKTPGERYATVRKRFSPFPLEDVFATIVERQVRKNASVSYRRNPYPVDPKYIGEKVELRVFDGRVRIFHGATLLGTFDARVNYRERMLRRLHVRFVKKDGTVRFLGRRYMIGLRHIRRRVEVMKRRDEVCVFISGNREKVFKLRRKYHHHR